MSHSVIRSPHHSARHLGKALAVVLLTYSLAGALSPVNVAQATPAHHSMVVTPKGNCIPQGCHTPLTWHGGPVQIEPRIYLIFWGSKWQNPTDPNYATLQKIMGDTKTLFKYLAGGAYNEILTQYYDDPNNPNSYVHNDKVSFQDSWIDATDPPSGGVVWDDICGIVVNSFYCEVQNALSNHPVGSKNAWTTSADTQFIVYPQPGTNITDPTLIEVCGAHGYEQVVNIPYIFDYVDTTNSKKCALSEVNAEAWTTHEYAEAATDPQYSVTSGTSTGWYSSDGSAHGEIGDLCANDFTQYPDPSNTQLAGMTFQALWDNSQNTCTNTASGLEFSTPASPTGFYTVKGAIYGDYNSSISVELALNYPISEEHPVPGAGGSMTYLIRQSDFQNGSIYYKPDTGAHEVQGAIYQDYTRLLQGPTGKQGFPTSDEQPISGGRYSTFQGTSCTAGQWQKSGSAIYWSKNTPASELRGCIYQRYAQDGSLSFLGFPTSNEQDASGGAFNTFQGTSCSKGPNQGTGSGLYWSSPSAAYGAMYVRGCIYQDYLLLSGPSGSLGYPSNNEVDGTSGNVSFFQGTNCTSGRWQGTGSGIFWSNGTANYGAAGLKGCIYQRYMNDPALQFPNSFLGYPTSNENEIPGGAFNTFQGTSCSAPSYTGIGSALYWNGSKGAVYFVRGCIYQAYVLLGASSSTLGLPVADEFYIPSVSEYESLFQNGCIYYRTTNQQISIYSNPTDC